MTPPPSDRIDAAELRQQLEAARAELDPLLAQLAERERELRAADAAVTEARAAVAADLARLRRVDESVVWRLFERARGRFYGLLGGRASRPARMVQSVLRAAGKGVGAPPPERAQPPPPRPIRFARVERPRVSIVVPVHARPELTERCLRSIAEQTDGPTYEVIVVDDAAPGHDQIWSALEHAHVIHNAEARGYLRVNNAAAEHARGEFLLLLNNDTEVTEGWLRALVARADTDRRIGIVVGKLLNMDGSLQEAGAIVFRDGSGWNFGRGADPNGPEYNYVREVDYGSAACMLVRARVWRELGGFDERFLPMYYEDTDLCFAARAAGHAVVFEPTAAVRHVEGGTAGTDPARSGKRFQAVNRGKFVEKWAERLESEHFVRADEVARRASDRNRGPHVLVIDHQVPSPDRDSGSLRMRELLKALLDIGCRVTFLPDNHMRAEPYTSELQAIGVEVLYAPLSVPAQVAAIGEQMRLAIVSRPHVASRYVPTIREYSPGATILFDTVDLHYIREQRRAELEGDAVAMAAEAWRELELMLMRVTDLTAVVTDVERDEIAAQLPDAEVVVLPNANAIARHVPPPAGREGLLFVGGFQHPPNADAVVWLVEEVMPLVRRELGDVELTVVGAHAPEEVVELEGPGVEIAGWVPDLQPLLESARVMVAPLRYGAGMKGKVTQSLAHGLPVVTTAVGAEGLGAADGRELLIADDPAGLAERIVRVYRDEELWTALSAAGQALVERTCSPETLRERLRPLVATPAVTLATAIGAGDRAAPG